MRLSVAMAIGIARNPLENGGCLRILTGGRLRIVTEEASTLALSFHHEGFVLMTFVLSAPALHARSSGRDRPAALVLVIILATLPDDHPRRLDRHHRAARHPRALGFSPTGLSWVQNAYTLTFGGLLLLGARAGDILGRRRVFMTGIAVFTIASLLGGLAPSAGLAARRPRRCRASAPRSPRRPRWRCSRPPSPRARERTRALALYSAVASGGGSIGLVLGGMLTSWVSWRWGLFINVPVGIALIVARPARPARDRPRAGPLRPARRDHLDARHDRARLRLRPRRVRRLGRPRSRVASFAAGARPAGRLRASTERRADAADHAAAPVRRAASAPAPTSPASSSSAACSACSSSSRSTCRACSASAPLQAGLAFLPMSVAMFAMVRVVPRYRRARRRRACC